jgi:acyl-CoA thioesterase-1
MKKLAWLLLTSVFLLSSCGGGDKAADDKKAAAAKASADQAAGADGDSDGSKTAAKAKADKSKTAKPKIAKPKPINPADVYWGVVVVGDNLSAAENMSSDQGWVWLLKKRLEGHGAKFSVINSSNSAGMTSSGYDRLSWLLSSNRPRLVIIELGSRDLRLDIPAGEIQNNLGKMIAKAQSQQAKVLLIGADYPAHGTEEYRAAIRQAFVDLGAQYKIDVIPNMLDHILENQALMQSDGINPNEAAQAVILENLWPQLDKDIKDSSAGVPFPY